MDVSSLKKRVSRHFFDLVGEDANPLVVALALQDNSSVGLQHHAAEFHELHEELHEALRTRVEASYQGLNESVGVYRQVVSSLKSTHESVQMSKAELDRLSDQFSKKKPILKDYHQKSLRYKRKLEILADLETLHQLAPTYEANVARKNYREARTQLSRALETINSRNLLNQPSIRPYLSYVQTQQKELVAKLVDEMHATIYLESPYSQKRLDSGNFDFSDFLRNLPIIPEPSTSDPEVNSFSYLGYLMQNLANLQSLSTSLDALCARIPLELQNMFLSTSLDVVNDLKLTTESVKSFSTGHTLLEQFQNIDQTGLEVLSRSIFNKLSRFLEAQRAITEIAASYGINYDLDHVCNSIIDSVQSFLLKYTVSQPGSGIQREKGSAIFRGRSFTDGTGSRLTRSKLKGSVFEFGPGDENSKSLRDFQTLREELKKSIPGLLADDPLHLFAETKQQERLEVVAPPHILNIRTLLEPSALFFAEVWEIAKSENSKKDFETFIDTFLRESFVPRLQEAFNYAIDDISEDEIALDEMKNWRGISQLPIVNSAQEFAETIGLLCQLLDTGSNYREVYAAMLVGLLSRIAKFYTTKLENIFKQVAMSASSSGNANFSKRIFKIWDFVTGNPEFFTAIKQGYGSTGNPSQMNVEFKYYLSKRQTSSSIKPILTVNDLLDVRIFKKVTHLITSLRWIVVRLRKMRRVANLDTNNHSDNITLQVNRRWSLIDGSKPFASFDSRVSVTGGTKADSTINVTALLAGRTLTDFDQLVAYLEESAMKALCALRADNFLRVVYYFDQMVTTRDFHTSNRGEERDPVVDRLQQELSLVSQVFESSLLTSDYRFLLRGIPQFMNELFMYEGEKIKDMNEAGQNQMLTNIFALQQMLTSIVSDPRDVDFSRATGFYELFRMNPTLILEKAREGETDLLPEDLKLLLQIRHQNSAASAGSHAFGTLPFHLSQVDEIFDGTHISSASSTTASPKKADPIPVEVTRMASQPITAGVNLLKGPEPLFSASTVRANKEIFVSQTSQKQRSPEQIEAETADNRLREESARQLAERQLQKEHEAQDKAQAERLRQEREALKTKSQESLIFNRSIEGQNYSKKGSTSGSSAVFAKNSDVVQLSADAVPSSGASKLPLLNHKLRFESNAQEHAPLASIPKVLNQNYMQQSRLITNTRQAEQPLRMKNSNRSLPKMQVNTSLPPQRNSKPSPKTPDGISLNTGERLRTPSEKALEASQKVSMRQLPRPRRRS